MATHTQHPVRLSVWVGRRRCGRHVRHQQVAGQLLAAFG